jgi:hypothetical protein
VALLQRARSLPGFELSSWTVLDQHGPALKDIRDAYEHIDERAFGRARGSEDNRNLMIFDHSTLVREGVVVYFDHRFALSDLDAVVDSCRAAIKELIGGPLQGVHDFVVGSARIVAGGVRYARFS